MPARGDREAVDWEGNPIPISWTANEKDRLVAMREADTPKRRWKNIAAELGTKRSPAACMRMYSLIMKERRFGNRRIALNEDSDLEDDDEEPEDGKQRPRVEWTLRHDEMLRDACDTLVPGKIYGERVWRGVSAIFAGKHSMRECRGRWERMCIAASAAPGEAIMRYPNHADRLDMVWTKADDALLREQVRIHGGRYWRKCKVPGRSERSMRKRFDYLSPRAPATDC